MRTCDKQVEVVETVKTIKTATQEELVVISEDKKMKNIFLKIELKDADNRVIQTKEIYIAGDYYVLLMSESPSFAIGKPANEYREEDLWYIVDLMEQEQSIK